MALFKAILGELSGKIGGNVFAHNRGGTYCRAWKVPTNPNTPLQQTARAAMASLVVAWLEDLSDAQRAAWATYAANVAMTNRLGDTIYLTGQNHFIRSNVPRLQAEVAVVEDAPVIFNLGAFGAIGLTITAVDFFTITYDDTDEWCDETGSYMISQQSPQMNTTINFFKSPFRIINVLPGDDVIPPNSPQFVDSYYVMTDGLRVFVRARVSRADGRLSMPQIVSAVVTIP